LRRTPPGGIVVLALALLGAALGGDHGAVPAPGAESPVPGLVAAGAGASGGLSGVEGRDLNYCTGCVSADYV
jgi:hypothetical protein